MKAAPKRKARVRRSSPPAATTTPVPDGQKRDLDKVREQVQNIATTTPVPDGQKTVRCDAPVKPKKYYLGREGVAFGPYSEWQLRESLRLGLFERNDLALDDDGQEWLELSRLLPASATPPGPPPHPSTPPPPAATGGKDWREVAELLPVLTLPRDQPPEHRLRLPLSEHLLREHEANFADVPAGSFRLELTRGRFAFAAVPVALVFLSLLVLAAVFKHREPGAGVQTHPRSASKLTAAPARVAPTPLPPVSLPVGHSAASAPSSPAAKEAGAIPADAVASTSH